MDEFITIMSFINYIFYNLLGILVIVIIFSIKYWKIDRMQTKKNQNEADGAKYGCLVYVVIFMIISSPFEFMLNFEIMPTIVDKTPTLLLTLIIFSIGLIFPYILIFIISIPLLRWKTISVFISYHHSYEKEARQFGDELERMNIQSLLVPFEPKGHDEVISQVVKHIKKSDFVLVLPSNVQSFVNSEILAATALNRPIALIKINNLQQLPNTAYKGYPIFVFDSLSKYNFTPLQHYIYFATGYYKDYLKDYNRIWGKNNSIWEAYGGLLFIFIPVLCFLVYIINDFASGFIFAIIQIIVATLAGFVYILFLYGAVKNYLIKRMAVKVSKQEIISGSFTKKKLENILTHDKDELILNCLAESYFKE